MCATLVNSTSIRERKPDPIFGASEKAQQAIQKYGKEQVVNATIGAILDENEEHVFLKSVEECFRNLSANSISTYAPIVGTKDYLSEVQNQCFGKHRPKGHIRAVATSGGTGGIHHLIHVYSELGDKVLTSDWYWGAYKTLCEDQGRELVTYTLLDENLQFNHAAFQVAVKNLVAVQKNVVLLMNTPAHNPTGYSISEADWDQILNFLKEISADGAHNIIIGVDVAYLDFAGQKDAVRAFFEKFGDLPVNILPIVLYSMSKGYTFYGQRTGAMMCITPDEQVAEEFFAACERASRSTWSNISHAAMDTLVVLSADAEKQLAYEEERNFYNELIHERAAVFMEEANEIGLPVVPYMAGFFLSIPSPDSKAVCDELAKENIFPVPLAKGVRFALCSVPKAKIKGLAAKTYAAMKAIGQL